MASGRGLKQTRVVGAVLFLCIFLLPFHLHAYTATPELQKECSCLHGSRAQLGSLPDDAPTAPLLWISAVVIEGPGSYFSFLFELRTIRAPPSIYSL